MSRPLRTWLVASLAVAACSPDDVQGRLLGPDLVAACAQAAEAECDLATRCLPVYFASDYGELDTCRARHRLACEHFLALPGVRLTATDVATCTQDLVTVHGCTALRSWDHCGGEPGALPAGATCRFDAQCASLWCTGQVLAFPAGVLGCGQCAPAPSGPARARPAGDRGPGQACAVAAACKEGLLCSDGLCKKPYVPVGGACSSASKCDHGGGYFCHPVGGVCEPVPLAEPGTACSLAGHLDGLRKDCHDGACVNTNDMGIGTCMAFAADGAACDRSAGPPCRWPAVCMDGTCEVTSACP